MDYVKQSNSTIMAWQQGLGKSKRLNIFSKAQNYSDFRTTVCYSMMN